MKKAVTLIFIFFIIILVFSSVFKIAKGIFWQNNERNPLNLIKKEQIPYWHKGSFVVPKTFLSAKLNNFSLIPGERYYLTQETYSNNICYLGAFYFKKKDNNYIYFWSEKTNKKSRLEHYAKIKKNLLK